MNIVSWNIENLAPWLAGGLPAQVEALGSPDVLCLQEIRLRPRDQVSLDDLLPGYRAFTALCDDPRNVTHRGGRAHGVATFVRGEATSEHPAWDREGRVLVVRTPGLAIVNLYAVNGTSRPYKRSSGSSGPLRRTTSSSDARRNVARLTLSLHLNCGIPLPIFNVLIKRRLTTHSWVQSQ